MWWKGLNSVKTGSKRAKNTCLNIPNGPGALLEKRVFDPFLTLFWSQNGLFSTRRRGGYSETLAGGQPGPARAAPPATNARVARGSGSCGGCESGGWPQRAAPGEQDIKQDIKQYDVMSNIRDGPKGETGKVHVVYNACKLLCKVLAWCACTSACMDRGGRRMTGGWGQGARRQDPEQPGTEVER